MADYYSILKKTIASLPENNGSARRNVYSRARNAIVSQLKAYEPPLSPSEITAEQLRLEEAIRKVEAEAARETLMATRPAPAAPAPMAPAGGASAPAPAPRAEPYPPSSPAPRAPLGSAVQEAERLGEASSRAVQTARDAFQNESAPEEPATERNQPRMEPSFGAVRPAGEAASAPAAPYATPAPEPRPAPSADEGLRPDPSAPRGEPYAPAGLKSSVPLDEPRKTRTRAPRKQRAAGGSSFMSYVFLAGFVLVLIGVGAFVFSQRSLIAGMFSSGEDTAATTGEPAPEAAAPEADAAAGGETPGKNTDRLLTDTGEPAVAPDARTVTTTLITPSTPAQPQEVPAAAPQAAAPVAAPAQPAAANAPGTIVAQKAFLYEEGEDASGSGTASPGNVAWSVTVETDAGGKKETVLVAQAQIPDRNVNLTVRIKPNSDSSLPASHLVEIQFQLPEGFSGGDVSNVPGLVMKPTEEARGDALLGASVKVAPGYFWIALSSVDSERDRNLALMRERGWIDIPMLYENGKRAIFTLEKGAPGARALELAIAAWQKG